KSRKWSLRWSVPVALALAIGSGYWGLVGGCAPAEDGNGNGAAKANTCEPLDDTDGGFEIRAFAVSSEGRELTYTMRLTPIQSREATQDDNIDDFDPGLSTQTTVTSDGVLVMSIELRGDATRQEVMVEYGTLITGIESSLAIVEDGMLSGMINDREIVPVPVEEADPNLPEFEDGNPAPVVDVPADLQAALIVLFEAAEVASQECDAQNGNSVARVAHTAFQDHGHLSLPSFSSGCIECKLGCLAGAGVCAGVAAGACVAALIFYAACKAPACGACLIAYAVCLSVCSADGAPCCPVTCGDSCCLVDETCLNFDSGLCCDAGKTTCVGHSCCSNTESCINAGPEAGTCCQRAPEDLLCGNACCNSGDICTAEISLCCPSDQPPCDGVCCDSGEQCVGETTCCALGNICGDACCDELDSGCIESLSLCCSFVTPVCGNKCCGIGESCLGGTLCCPSDRVCAGVCCEAGSGCNAQNTCEACPNANEKFCSESGTCCPTTKVCSPIADLCCDAGELYCFGMCQHPSGCVN
ncbi:MAG: hypothetical protein O7D91_08580, partial [Planctomycetota bacterium]|nr:hypothetical protein [Planctomycetota bacterium]